MRKFYNIAKEQGANWLAKRLLDQLRIPFLKTQAIRAARHAAKQPRNANHVVIVCDRLHVRGIKIAFALRSAGWEVALIYRQSFSYDISESFNETRQFRNHWDALLLASEYRPVAYHVFSSWDYRVATTLIKNKPGKIVLDTLDVLAGMVKEEILQRFPGQIELEKYCYENADGICCRDLRAQYLKRKLGYKLPQTILFQEYCWPAGKVEKLPKLRDGIHAVYVGGVELNPASPVAYQYELAALLARNNIHFHIYLSDSRFTANLRLMMGRYVMSDLLDKYVHIHDSISPLEIGREISKYHFGLIISTKNIDYADEHDTYFHHVSDYFFSAKIFDYLDSGLFTLTQNARFVRFILRRYNSGKVVKSLEDIVLQCKSEPPDVTIPESLLLGNNISRLALFYTNLNR